MVEVGDVSDGRVSGIQTGNHRHELEDHTTRYATTRRDTTHIPGERSVRLVEALPPRRRDGSERGGRHSIAAAIPCVASAGTTTGRASSDV
jgi:hypothetical protein